MIRRPLPRLLKQNTDRKIMLLILGLISDIFVILSQKSDSITNQLYEGLRQVQRKGFCFLQVKLKWNCLNTFERHPYVLCAGDGARQPSGATTSVRATRPAAGSGRLARGKSANTDRSTLNRIIYSIRGFPRSDHVRRSGDQIATLSIVCTPTKLLCTPKNFPSISITPGPVKVCRKI